MNEKKETLKCKKCNDNGWYQYTTTGTPHSKPCEVCCAHAGKSWKHEDGKYYCRAGCGSEMPAPTPQVEEWTKLGEQMSKLGVAEWAKQGRTDEQIYGVKNFLTGLGGKKIQELVASREQQAYERGYENGKLAEIEAGTRGEIEIVKEKVKQLRQAERERIVEGFKQQTADIVHAEFCRKRGEQFKECARCLLDRLEAFIKNLN